MRFTTFTKVLLGETRAALVQTTEEFVGIVNNKNKVLMVDCEVEEDGCMKEVPHLWTWRRIHLNRKDGGGHLLLEVDGKEFLEQSVRRPFLLQSA